jgi:polyhydroxyalkanoate synthesis regulator phasin
MSLKNLLRVANAFEKNLTKKSEDEAPLTREEIIEELKLTGDKQGDIKDEIGERQLTGEGDEYNLYELRKRFERLEEKVFELRKQLKEIEAELKKEESELGEDLDPYSITPDYD